MNKREAIGKHNKRSKFSAVRAVLPWVILGVVALGFALRVGFGTLSDFGWMDISILCPLGALTAMVASRSLIPRALVSLAVVVVLVVLFGKSFCAWACPVPVVSKLRQAFSRRAQSQEQELEQHGAALSESPDGGAPAVTAQVALTEGEKALLSTSCGASCSEARSKIDSRHFIAGGAVLSAAVFGFPVFCLICPIGLTFATVFFAIRAFGFGDVGLGLLVAPVLLLVEVVFFRKWCHRICPLGALMSLVAKANRTARPVIDDGRCIESSRNRVCGACSRACPEGINPRHPELSKRGMNECTRCRKCADICPASAVNFPIASRKGQ